MNSLFFRSVILNFLFLCLCFSSVLWAGEIPEELLKLDLEELLQIEVTSAARHPQKFRDAPSAIYLITAEDLHRSFDNELPELLRGVPGVHVARVTSSDWAISIRGFNDRFANKLLVLIDGRTLYTPLFSGVFWERQDTVIEDLDRIEIIRGPGASLWGANAVNGVINIVSKSAWETQGWLTSIVVGSEESQATLRYGGRKGQEVAYRLYVKAKEVGSLKIAHDGSAHDDWRMAQTGFRLDWNLSEDRRVRLSGDTYTQTASVLQSRQSLNPPYEIFRPTDGYGFGANLMLKIEEESQDSGWSFKTYYDTARASGFPLLNWNLDIIDAEFLRYFRRSNHEWTWGLGYRLYIADIKNSDTYAYDPSHSKTYVFNTFLQDEINFKEGIFRLILGSKFEYDEEVGLEIQPTVRFLWKISSFQTFWAAISRAVRTPSRGEMDAIIDLLIPQTSGPPLLIRLKGNKDLDAEELIAFEIGYRHNFSNLVSLDLATFFNFYDDLIALPVPQDAPVLKTSPAPYLFTQTEAENLMDGETYGLELSLRSTPFSNLFLSLNYTYLKLFLHSKRPTLWLGEELEEQWPRHLLSFVSCYTFSPHFHVDFRLRYASKLPAYDVPSYWASDLKLHWYLNDRLEISLVGQNLFDPEHPEFGQAYALRTPLREVQRSVFLKIIWKH